MNILNSGRFGVGAGAGGGLRKLIGIKNRNIKQNHRSVYISLYFKCLPSILDIV